MPDTSGLPAGEVTPPLQPDFGHVFLDVVLPCSVEHAYKLMFSNSVVGAYAWTEAPLHLHLYIAHRNGIFSAHPLPLPHVSLYPSFRSTKMYTRHARPRMSRSPSGKRTTKVCWSESWPIPSL